MVLNSIRFDLALALALALALTLAQYCYRVYCLFSVGNVRQKLSLTNKLQISSHLAPNNLDSVFYYLFYFWYYLWALLLSLILFMNHTVLFQLTFIFIYELLVKDFQFQRNKQILSKPLFKIWQN